MSGDSRRGAVCWAIAHERLAGPREIAPFGDGSRRDTTPVDQAMRQPSGDPGGVVHVALTPRDLAPVPRVGEHERALAVEDTPAGVSKDPRRRHRPGSDPAAREPVR